MALTVSVAQDWVRAPADDSDAVSSSISVASGDVLVAVMHGAFVAPDYTIEMGSGAPDTVIEATGLYVGVKRFISSASATVRATALYYGFGDPALKVYKVTGAAPSPVGFNAAGSAGGNVLNPGATMTDAAGVLFGFGWMGDVTGAPTSSNLTYTTSASASANLGGGRPISGYRAPGAAGSQSYNLDGPGTTSGTWHAITLEIVETAATASRKGWGVVR